MAWGSMFKGAKKTGKAPTKLQVKAKPAVKPAATRTQLAAPAKPAASAAAARRVQESELARVVFHVLAAEKKTYANRQELAAGWRNERPQHLRMARQIMRRLERHGIQLSGVPRQAKMD